MLRKCSTILFVVTVSSLSARAQMPLGQSTPECPAGTMLAPQAAASGMPSGIADPKAAAVNALKKKIVGDKSAKTDSTASPKAPRCLTPDQYAAEAQAQQKQAMKGMASAMVAATPVGMAVVGAKAAAPVAGKVAGALSGRFHRGPSKEKMQSALEAGRFVVEDISFNSGAETFAKGADKVIAMLADVMKESKNNFVIRVTDESDGKTSSDSKLSQARATALVAKMIEAGVPASRIAAAPVVKTASWDNAPAKKSAAHPEILTVKGEAKQ